MWPTPCIVRVSVYGGKIVSPVGINKVHPILSFSVLKALLFFSCSAAILLMIMWYFQTQRVTYRHFKGAKTQPARQSGIYSDPWHSGCHSPNRSHFSSLFAFLHGRHTCISFELFICDSYIHCHMVQSLPLYLTKSSCSNPLRNCDQYIKFLYIILLHVCMSTYVAQPPLPSVWQKSAKASLHVPNKFRSLSFNRHFFFLQIWSIMQNSQELFTSPGHRVSFCSQNIEKMIQLADRGLLVCN